MQAAALLLPQPFGLGIQRPRQQRVRRQRLTLHRRYWLVDQQLVHLRPDGGVALDDGQIVYERLLQERSPICNLPEGTYVVLCTLEHLPCRLRSSTQQRLSRDDGTHQELLYA